MATQFQWSNIFFGLLAILGLLLLIAALFPRRRGETPYCRRCRYNLTGIKPERCPECGAWLNVRRAVLRGERRRRVSLAIVGAVVLLGGTGPLGVKTYRWAESGRWYSYLPIAWVTDDFFTSTAGPTCSRASTEIRDRLKQARLSEVQLRRLTERLLDALAPGATPAAPMWAIVGLGGEVYATGRLDQDQRTKLFETCFQVSAAARSELPAGHLWRTALAMRLRVPKNLWVHVRAHCTLDGVRSRLATFETKYSGVTLPELIVCPVPKLDEGRHEMSYVVEFDFYERGYGVEPGSLYHFARTLNLSTEVLAQVPDDYIRLIRAPELKTRIRDCLRITHAFSRPDETGGMVLQVGISAAGSPPIGLAFDVAAEFDGQLLALGRYALSPSDYARREGRHAGLAELFQGDAPKTVTLVFTPSRRAAIESIDLYEIWDGELRFEDVLVQPVP